MHEERDDTVERVRASLKRMPPADPRAIARVLTAVHGREPSPTPRWREFMEWMRMPSMSVAGAGVLAVGALMLGFVVRPVVIAPRKDVGTVATATQTDAVPVAASPVAAIPAVANTDGDAVVPVQFVFESTSAQSVSVVGDFNDWKLEQSPMQRYGKGAWAVTLPIKPGRHVYAFVVDGVRWQADPRAPRAADSDFGKPGSVVVVNTP